jgi:hypothetical protein
MSDFDASFFRFLDIFIMLICDFFSSAFVIFDSNQNAFMS